jgi:predicted DNA-binding protein (MmcQ/YjbR family)
VSAWPRRRSGPPGNTRKQEVRFSDAFLAKALAYPEAHEDHPWGETVVKVRGKIFVFLGSEKGTFGFSVKLPQSHGAALLLPFAEPTGYGLGKSGWVSARFREGEPIPEPLLFEWLDESYRAVAPKKLVAQLPATS